MRTSDLFVLTAKLALMGGLDYKNNPEINSFERDAIETGLRELGFYNPAFKEKYESLATRPVGQPAGAAKRVKG